jgi:hypothetical protein
MLLGVMFISACGVFSDADEKIYFSDTRRPDAIEYQYLALASEIHSAKPCYLVHPDSLRKGAFNSVGNQAAYERSECFFAVAISTGDAEICDKVRSVSTVFLSGADFNANSCRRQATGRGGISYDLDVPQIVALAGYTESEVDSYLVAEGRFSSIETASRYRQDRSNTYWGEVRRNLLHSAEFFERIGHLRGFGTSADQAEMRAMIWKPRPQRQLVPPEERTRSTPQIRIRVQAE